MKHKALFVLGFTVAAGVAAANDAWVGNGGSPKLMAPHPTVRMLREKVRIHVGKKKVTVEAEFWFRNGGPTTATNVGFPDESTDPDDKPILKNFRSWVDGKPAKMQFKATGGASNWHVKRVTFPKGRVVHVRDRYEVNIGSGRLGNQETFADYVRYTVHTGSSWKGTIGETDLRVTIASPQPYPRRLIDSGYYWEFVNKQGNEDQIPKFIRRHRNTVFYSGIGKPRRAGRELIFVRRNWRPTEADNLSLVLNARRDVEYEREIQGD
jgi:hypothetical protein